MFDEPISEFFGTDDFAEVATYTPSGGTPVTVNGIFDLEYVDIDLGGIPIAGLKAVFTCATDDIPGGSEGDAISVRGVDYTIMVCQPDGTGVTKLILEEV